MKAALILFIVALGVVCLNARPVEDEENLDNGNNNGEGLVYENEGLSRQKRSSHRRHHQISSSSSSEEQRGRRRHSRGRALGAAAAGAGAPGAGGRAAGPPKQQGRQFLAAAPVAYGAPGYYPGMAVAAPAPVVYG